mgnify:FL=1|tara:strand:+ start:1650 stop:1955 length:306 start_codon:yes stop_codon:yes gene_type:complete
MRSSLINKIKTSVMYAIDPIQDGQLKKHLGSLICTAINYYIPNNPEVDQFMDTNQISKASELMKFKSSLPIPEKLKHLRDKITLRLEQDIQSEDLSNKNQL